MNTPTALFQGSTRLLISAGIAAAAVVAIPAIASAATFAYVTQAGDVSTVTADTAAAALATAPGIGIHSGVMLLVTPTDDVVGDHVQGI